MFIPKASMWALFAGHLALLQQLPAQTASYWVSTASGSMKWKGPIALDLEQALEPKEGKRVYHIDTALAQTVDGMGSSLEPSSCYNLSKLAPEERRKVLQSLFDPQIGLGMNLMRICIGTPDFTGDPWYTYHDLSPGEEDPAGKFFQIARDEAYILPVLREAMLVNPALRFFASPWSPPAWMKTPEILTGGRLQPRFYGAYATYLVQFLKAYAKAGIPVMAITVQNEPGVDREKAVPRWRYPSCHWTAEAQRDFIRDHLGPALRQHHLTTEIWCYDHNYNEEPLTDNSQVFRPGNPSAGGIRFPRTVLRDTGAAKYTAAIAFHGYVGKPQGMSVIQEEFPMVPVRFTEGSIFGLAGGVKLMDILKNRAISYNAWVTMLDQARRPNNGPFRASKTMVERDTLTNQVHYHFDYYLYGHFMRFLTPGSRIVKNHMETPKQLHLLSAKGADGRWVNVVINEANTVQEMLLERSGYQARLSLPGRSVATLQWP